MATFDPLNVEAALQGYPVSLSKPDRVVAAKALTAQGLSGDRGGAPTECYRPPDRAV